MLNDETSPDHIAGARVVAAFKGGSKDVESSYSRVDKYAEELRTKYKVELVSDIPALCRKVDAVLIESVDGRMHLPQAKQVIAAHKPMFIDKPLASTLEDAREIARLAKEAGVSWFSASSLRYGEIATTMKHSDTQGVITWGPGPLEEHHQLDLSWYAIHPIEMLFALMGTGVEEVTRTYTPGADMIVGRWKDGRIGTVRAMRPYGDYGAVVFRPKSVEQSRPKSGSPVPAACGGDREVLRYQTAARAERRNPGDLRVHGCGPAQQGRGWKTDAASVTLQLHCRDMPNLLEGKLALVLGIANKWSLAYAIARAFAREGATLALTYLGEHQKESIEELCAGLNVAAVLPCDVTRDEDLANLTASSA